MRVEVHLHTLLQRKTPEGWIRRLPVELAEGSTLADILHQLDITFPLDALLLVVNGRMAGADHPLQDGDQVNLMPAISGGSRRFKRKERR